MLEYHFRKLGERESQFHHFEKTLVDTNGAPLKQVVVSSVIINGRNRPVG